MLYGKYLFSSVFERDAVLPHYKGSTFRGVFGLALKKVVCALKRQDCSDCLLRERCVYSLVFEIPITEDTKESRARIAAPPHPYVIEPPETIKTHFQKGESFDFTLILFGKANEYLPYFIYAFEQMGRLGIGKRIEGKRAGFSLNRVTVCNETIYSSETQKMKSGDFTNELKVSEYPSENLNPIKTLDLNLVTPLRLKFDNRLEGTLPFHIFTRAMLRRISSLCNFHGDGEPALDYKGLVERAKSVETIESCLRWYDWKRYSNKQDRSMLMGGMVGNVTYSGDLTEFLPLVRFCEKTHLGKQTSFGLGKIEIAGIG